jgi:hypothetical protein
MAYFLHHNLTFQSRITENIRIELYKKDEEPGAVTSLRAMNFRQSYPKGEGDKFDSIIACEISFDIWLKTTDTVNYYDFLVTLTDEWKVIAYSDEQVIFVGFLTPGEGTAEFQNKPYSITLNAVDGIGLLKGVPLTDINGDDFEGINLISDYIAAIAAKTGCDIPLRMYSSWIEESMTGRLTNPNKDTFNQTGIHKRTFLNEKVEFFDCYECLRRILEGCFCFYQWNGMWVVLNIGEMQAGAGPRLWYTEYDSTGTVTGSGQADENPCPIGHDLIIHPINRTQNIGSLLSIKSAKHRFNYVPPPELVNNQDLSRLGAFISPLSSSGNTAWQIIGWTKYENDMHNETAYAGAATTPYIRLDIDAFGNEVFRYYRLGGDNTAGGTITGYIRNDNDDFWVYTNDRFDISVTYRVSDSLVTPRNIVIVALKIDGTSGASASDWYTLGENGNWVNNDTTVMIDHDPGAGTNKWLTVDIEADPFPADGNVYILLGTGDMNTTQFIDYKAPNITYKPFFSDPLRTFAITNLAGTGANLIPFVITNPNDTAPKGDYWFTEQNANLLDKVDEEVYISDTNRRSIKGSLFRGTTTVLTSTTWHRDNVTEERHFKELVNQARFNHAYRRMWKSRGNFSGLKWQPNNDTTIFEPLSFHRHFYFANKSELSGKHFMLVPPLIINHDSGICDATFVECLDTALVEGVSGVTPEQVAYQLASLITATTDAEWDSASGAPSPGTPWFPPFAVALGNKVIIYMNTGDNPTGSANHGGAGNSPSLTLDFNNTLGTLRQAQFSVGGDVQPGNVFTISIYGHDVSFTSSSVTTYQDGNQLGDTHTYSIAFK